MSCGNEKFHSRAHSRGNACGNEREHYRMDSFPQSAGMIHPHLVRAPAPSFPSAHSRRIGRQNNGAPAVDQAATLRKQGLLPAGDKSIGWYWRRVRQAPRHSASQMSDC